MAGKKMKKISIIYASDEKYAAPLTVSMYSVLANTTHHIDFYILENNIKLSTKEKIQKSLKDFNNYTLTFIPIDLNKVKNFPDLQWYSLNMYSRYFIPEILDYLDKCIYLDVDIILKHDIADLFSTDLDEFALAAVVGEPDILKENNFREHLKILGLASEHIYFGSGVLIFNSRLWRDKNLVAKLLKITDRNKNKLKYPDQDALNILFNNNQYKKLDLFWNRDLNQLKKDVEQKVADVSSCHLIHFDGPAKPWDKNVFCDDLFWSYAIRTVFYKKPSFFTVFSGLLRYKFCISKKRQIYKNKYKRLRKIFES